MSEQIPQNSEIGIVHVVGTESIAVITRLNPVEDNQEYVGNILRRTCVALGEGACVQGCAIRAAGFERGDYEKQCADGNLADALTEFGIAPGDVLMVAVTGDDVGFGDQLEDYDAAGKLARNPEGWRELPGYNAFFARPSEVSAIGSRLADCAHIEFEFNDSEGETVVGFEHGTRPNMSGKDKYSFEFGGQSVSYTHFVMAKAIEHYGADPAGMNIRLSSSIRPENFVKQFENEEQLEKHIPGWRSAGFAVNISNPDWSPGIPMVSESGEKDIWHADARGLIMHDITEAMQSLGISAEQFVCDDMLDPADTGGEFSSHQNSGIYGDSRDLYLVAHASAFAK